MPRVKVILHGALLEAYDKPIEIEARTPRMVLSALKLIPELSPANNKNRYLCKMEGVQTVTDLDEPLEVSVVNIYCESCLHKDAITGSGNNPYVRIIIGVILVIIGFFVSLNNPLTGMAIMSAGLSLIFGGITQILTKKPKMEDQDKNKSLTGYENTVKSGTPISIIIGEHLHGGHLFSINTETRNGKKLNITEFKSQYAVTQSTSWLLLYDGTDDVTVTTRPPGGKRDPEDFNPFFPELLP